MILSWTHNQADGSLTCVINEDLSYVTLNGGGTFKKYYQNTETEILSNEAWEDEKHWISENFSDIVGKYTPQWGITEDEWMRNNPDYVGALPLFGVTADGQYLDKLMRPAFVQEGRDMNVVIIDESNQTMIEVDNEGNYWKRPWCEERQAFYNIQPCCVFPYNPGREPLDKQEAESIIRAYKSY